MGSQADTNQALYTVPLKAGADGKVVANNCAVTWRTRHRGRCRGGLGGQRLVRHLGGGVYVESSDSDALKQGSSDVLAMLKTVPGLTNINSDLSDARDMLSIDVDEDIAPTRA